MKTYTKTKWVDNQTPVNAENLNKIESAIQSITENALSPSDLVAVEDGGIMISTECGQVKFELQENVLRSDSISSITVIDDETNLDLRDNKNFSVLIDDIGLDAHFSKPSYQMYYSGRPYFPVVSSAHVNMENGEKLEEYIRAEVNALIDKINELQLKIEDLEQKLNDKEENSDVEQL